MNKILFPEDLRVASLILDAIITKSERNSILRDVEYAMLVERIVIAKGLVDSVRVALKEQEDGIEL